MDEIALPAANKKEEITNKSNAQEPVYLHVHASYNGVTRTIHIAS